MDSRTWDLSTSPVPGGLPDGHFSDITNAIGRLAHMCHLDDAGLLSSLVLAQGGTVFVGYLGWR